MNKFFFCFFFQYISKWFSAFATAQLIINITQMYLLPDLYNAHIWSYITIYIFCANLQHFCSINPIFLSELIYLCVITKFMGKFCNRNSQDCIVCKWINASKMPILVYFPFKQNLLKSGQMLHSVQVALQVYCLPGVHQCRTFTKYKRRVY